MVLSRAAPCRHLANTLEWKAQRCALLFGAVDTAKKTITVEAIYEPPQKDADNAAYDASNLVLRGRKRPTRPSSVWRCVCQSRARLRDIEGTRRFAPQAMLGLQPVGWIFSHADERDAIQLSARDVVVGAPPRAPISMR